MGPKVTPPRTTTTTAPGTAERQHLVSESGRPRIMSAPKARSFKLATLDN